MFRIQLCRSSKLVRHRLSDDEWHLISDPYPAPTGVGRPPNDPRDMMDVFVGFFARVLRGGMCLRRSANCLRFGMRLIAGIAMERWQKFLSRLMSSHVDVGLLRNDVWLVDATIVRAARCERFSERN